MKPATSRPTFVFAALLSAVAALGTPPKLASCSSLFSGIHAIETATQAPASGRNTSAASLVLTDVTVIDGTGAPARSGMSVVIEDGHIRDIGPTGTTPVPDSAQVLELSGHYVIPGLINSHLHLLMLGITPPRTFSRVRATGNLERMLFAGVTTVRDPAGDARVNAELARLSIVESRPLPRVYFAARFAGPSFYSNGGGDFTSMGYERGTAPWAQAVNSATNVPLAIARAVGTGASGIKFYSDIESDLLDRLVAEAHQQGLEAWSHATIFPTGPLEAVRAGVDVLSHVCFIPWGLQSEVQQSFARRSPYDSLAVDPSDSMYQLLFTQMVAGGTILDATASNAMRNPMARSVGCTPDVLMSILQSAHEAGVELSTGTDYFISDGEPDPTLYTEIEFLVESAILNPVEAIRAATLNGARALGLEESLGTVEPGKIADLVVLTADPSRDIRNLRQIRAVIKGGIVFPRQVYDEAG